MQELASELPRSLIRRSSASSAREERDRLLADLERERRRANEERQRGEQLQAELETLRASQTAAEASEGTEPRPSTGEAQEGSAQRSWWRRMFGSD
jgi:hypothetical protein